VRFFRLRQHRGPPLKQKEELINIAVLVRFDSRLHILNFMNKLRLLCFGLAFLRFGALPSFATDSTYVRFNTSLGNIDVQMLSSAGEAPMNVANFMNYVTNHAYNGTFIHRSISDFVIQGGGYFFDGNAITAVAQNAPVTGEPGISNQRGTLAMALTSGPNTGTNQWFFNLTDNSFLDTQRTVTNSDGSQSVSGPFTVFGVVANASSLAVMDAIAAVPTFAYNSPFDDLPLENFTTADYNAQVSPPLADFIYVNTVTPLMTTDFSTWQSTNFQGQPASVSAPTATPQNDETPNLLKYLCDVTPAQSMMPADRAKLPTVGSAVISGTQVLTLTYRQRADLVGVFVSVQTSTDLQTWAAPTNATTTQTATTDSSGDTIMQVQVPVPAGGTQFIRLSLTQ
jgi:peptidyl-prolyl cis-trans isomerase A (cyclophilin A)